MIDFGYRSTHEMTLKAKQIVKAFYDQSAKYSYFKGCSTGGRMALMEAQRYPDDYDGIIAGSLANRHIHMWTAGVARSIELSRHPEGNLTAEKAALVNRLVTNTCDTLKEGFLNNPRQCKVDFSKLKCAGGQGRRHVPDGRAAEDGRHVLRRREELEGRIDLFRPGARQSDRRASAARTSRRAARSISSASPTTIRTSTGRNSTSIRDMPFIDKADRLRRRRESGSRASSRSSGGKLLLTHGWADTGITPETTIWYYDSVLDKMGKNQSDWMRLFMAPGMGHCGGGPGVNTFDSIGTLEKWVEKGIAPDQMLGTGAQGLTRPLCPYPQYAEYKGTGDLKDAANWACKAPAAAANNGR